MPVRLIAAAGLTSGGTIAGNLTVSGDVTVTGALDHDGSTVGLFAVAPATRTTGVAQLTDNTGATANDTIENVPAAVVGVADASVASVNTALTAIENNLADLTAKLNAVMTAIKAHGIIGA